MSLLIVEGVKVFDFVDDGTKDMPMNFIIVEFDVDPVRRYIAFGILDKQLLLPLNEGSHSVFSEYVQEHVMLLANDAWH